jgi:hypothetical protein
MCSLPGDKFPISHLAQTSRLENGAIGMTAQFFFFALEILVHSKIRKSDPKKVLLVIHLIGRSEIYWMMTAHATTC